MKFSIKGGQPEKQKTGCVVVGIYSDNRLSPSAKQLDQASGGALRQLLKRGDLDPKVGSTLMLHQLPKVLAERVLLVSVGPEGNVTAPSFRDAVRGAVKALLEGPAKEVCCTLSEIPVKAHALNWRIRQIALIAEEVAYRFDTFKRQNPPSLRRFSEITLMVEGRNAQTGAEKSLQQAQAIAQGQSLARTLGNLPANVCTPTYLAEEAQKMAKALDLECTILEAEKMRELGMGSFLSVTQGSTQPPKLIVLSYRGNGKRKPVVLVGKGITFDSGGISLKPGADMDEMKFDMCGAASVLGTLQAVAQMKLPLNVIALVPTCENMPSGHASRPGDIVTSLSGQTIEILNTDAEGRLILCDALTYAERFKPEQVIDVATLTGACVIALGHVAAGLYSNDDKLALALLQAGEEAHDRAWHMPLWSDYQEQLKSNFADMANIGGRPGGSITAACFLSRFTEKYAWAHLDIAGVSHKSGAEKGATGRPVPLLTHYLLAKAGKLI